MTGGEVGDYVDTVVAVEVAVGSADNAVGADPDSESPQQDCSLRWSWLHQECDCRESANVVVGAVAAAAAAAVDVAAATASGPSAEMPD